MTKQAPAAFLKMKAMTSRMSVADPPECCMSAAWRWEGASMHSTLTPEEEQQFLQAQVSMRATSAQRLDLPVKNCPLPLREYFKYFFLRAPFLLTMNHTAKREAFLEPRQSSSCVFSHCSDFFCLFEKEEQIFCLVPKMQMPLCNSLRWWEAPTVVDKILMGQPIVCPQVSVFLL